MKIKIIIKKPCAGEGFWYVPCMSNTTKTMRAIFIDARNKTVSEIQLGKDYKEISKKIGCDLFTVATTYDNGDGVFVDDEGLINGTFDFFFCPAIYPHPLAGNGIILGSDREGDSVSAKTAIADLGEFQFMNRDEVVKFHLGL